MNVSGLYGLRMWIFARASSPRGSVRIMTRKVLQDTLEHTQSGRYRWRIVRDIGMVVFLSMLTNTIVLQHFERFVQR
jgi:hypothetical protein